MSILSATHPKQQIITHAPLICIEVLSPLDSLTCLGQKMTDYAAFGVPNIWVFDPSTSEVWICTADAMNRFTGDVLTASGIDIAIPLAEIWADLD